MIELPNGVRLPELTIDDYIGLAEEAWKHRHEAAVRTVTDSGLKPEDRMRALDQLDQMRGTRGPLVQWAFTYAGTRRVIEVAAAKGGVKPSDAMQGIGVEALARVALTLVGVDLDVAEARAEASAGVETDPTPASVS